MIVYVAALAIRLLLFWGYHSTDFEVHRNWKAITYNLPLKDWYYEATSEWTLDYPPFFAYFEYVLSHGGRYFDENLLKISSKPYESEKTVFFMRLTVILSELVLVWSLYLFKDPGITAMILLNPGLVYLDHIHFQYNGMMLGMFFFCIHFVNKGKFLQGALMYSTLLMFKHIYLYFAPAFLFFYLKHYCCLEGKILMKKVIFCGVSVVSVMILAFFPFRGDLVAVKNRLFPWGRGLTHAYWAPNFWSLYNAIDVLLNFFLNKQFKTEYTQGLVRICNHAVLPNVTPPATFALILAGLVFLAWFIQRSDNSMFCESLSVSGMIFFMFGWHVHEKAIMTISLPMIILYKKYPKSIFFLNFFAVFSLFPLIFEILEQGFVLMSFLSYFSVLFQVLPKEKIALYPKFWLISYLVYMFFNWIVKLETFIPLLTISVLSIQVYNSLGIIWTCWIFSQELKSLKQKQQ